MFTQCILPSNLAKERLINYSIFLNIKVSFSLRSCTLFRPPGCQSAQTLIICLHYITLLGHFATCTVYNILVVISAWALVTVWLTCDHCRKEIRQIVHLSVSVIIIVLAHMQITCEGDFKWALRAHSSKS